HRPRRAEARPTAERSWVGLQADALHPHRHRPRRAEARPTAERSWVGLQADALHPHRHRPRRAEARPTGDARPRVGPTPGPRDIAEGKKMRPAGHPARRERRIDQEEEIDTGRIIT